MGGQPAAGLERSPGRWVGPVGASAYALCAALLLAVSIEGSLRLVGATFPGFLVWDNGTLVAFHEENWTGARAGLPLNGGVVVGVDGAPFVGGRALLAHAAERAEGEPITYRVREGDALREYRVPTMRLSWRGYLVTFGTYFFVAIAFLGIGALALALRPDLREARALAWASGSIGALIALTPDYLTQYRLATLCQMLEGLTPAAMASFALVFPVARGTPRSRGAVVLGMIVVLAGAGAYKIGAFQSDPQLHRALTGMQYALISGLAVVMAVSFGEALLRARDPARRTQAAIVFAAALPSFVLPASGILAFTLLGWSYSWTWSVALMPLFPAALLYAIVRHDLLEPERVVRLAVGYTVSTAAVVLGYAVGIWSIGRLIWPGVASSPATTFGLLLALALSVDPIRRRVQVGIDRAFFRSRFDGAAVLEESGAELAMLSDEGEIAGCVSRVLDDALALEWVHLILRSDPPASRESVLSEVVSFGGEELGRIECGLKRSGAPFSRAERDLIKGMAAQSALALHNASTIDALREAQVALLRSARLVAVGEFAGSVAHGIRNPLAAIRAAAQVAHREADPGPLRESLEHVLGEADRLERRIRSLLDFSRPNVPSLQPTDVGDVLRSVRASIEPYAERVGVKLEIGTPDDPVEREVDANYLEEALLELVANALRAMPDGGELRIALERRTRSVRILVEDTGSGIPEGVRERIFELFFTTRVDGSGMGLARVKKIVESHGGTIRLERSDKSGTLFSIELR